MKATIVLQWGHRLSPVETHCHHHYPSLSYLASMGPPAFAGGNSPTAGVRRSNSKLQWGHRLSPVETVPLRASAAPTASFNGATGFRRWKLRKGWTGKTWIDRLQWGHRLSPVETRKCSGKSTFTLRLQWGHRLSPVETTSHVTDCRIIPSCFNGATGFRRWKRADHIGANPPLGASMGPPAFAGGNTNAQFVAHCPDSRFNGATGFRRWKPPLPALRHSPDVRLQWGHRLSPVETRTACGSMSTWTPLQWGHRLSPVETRDGGSYPAALAELQWGHRLSPVETRFVSTNFQDCFSASMGPPAFAGGN